MWSHQLEGEAKVNVYGIDDTNEENYVTAAATMISGSGVMDVGEGKQIMETLKNSFTRMGSFKGRNSFRRSSSKQNMTMLPTNVRNVPKVMDVGEGGGLQNFKRVGRQ